MRPIFARKPEFEPLDRLNILAFDCEPIRTSGTLNALLKAGANSVTIVSTIDEAWEALERQRFDLAILERDAPDGFSFPVAMYLLGKGVPAVARSGHSSTHKIEKFDGLILCPEHASADEIISACQRALEPQQRRDAQRGSTKRECQWREPVSLMA